MGIEINTKSFLKNLKDKGYFKECASVIELGSQDDSEKGDAVFEILKNDREAKISLDTLKGRVCAGGGGLFYN